MHETPALPSHRSIVVCIHIAPDLRQGGRGIRTKAHEHFSGGDQLPLHLLMKARICARLRPNEARPDDRCRGEKGQQDECCPTFHSGSRFMALLSVRDAHEFSMVVSAQRAERVSTALPYL